MKKWQGACHRGCGWNGASGMTHDIEWFDGARGSADGLAGQSCNAALTLLTREGPGQKIF